MAKSESQAGVSIRFRAAVAEDRTLLIPLINSAFAIETFLEGTRTDEARLAATMEKGSILVAEEGAGQLLGCVYMEVRGKRGYLGQLAVDPAHRGAGLARLLVEAAEEHLRAQRCEGVDITVLSRRTELPRIYRRYGYIATGMEEFHMTQALKTEGECHCIAMSKEF